MYSINRNGEVIDPEEILLKNQYGLIDWVVYDPIQKTLIIFGTGIATAKYLNITKKAFEYRYAKSKLDKKYSFEINGKYVSPYAIFRKETKEVLEEIDKREETNKRKKSLSINYKIKKALPIEVTDLQTGETKVYNSSEEFSNILNVNKKTFQRHILYHNGVWKNKYKVKYLKDN